jgi:Metallo-peptidase family M12
MKALPSSATFGLLAVPSTITDPVCDNTRDPRPTGTLNDEHYERQNGDRCHAPLETHRSASSRCMAIILVVAGLLISGAVASACAYHRPATTIVIRLNNAETITGRRKRIDENGGGSTWRGEIEETGEPVVLMQWNDGRFSGMFTYRGQMYTLKCLEVVGGEMQAAVDADSGKVPSHHGSVVSPPEADWHDAPLAARSLAAMKRARHRGTAQPQSEPTPGANDPIQPRIAPLAPAERQAMIAKKITIDVMVLYTSKAASKYVDVETDLIANSIEEANQSFIDSAIGNIRLRLVHSQKIDYDEAGGTHFDHLYQMVDGVGTFSKIGAWRDAKRADVVVLIVDDGAGCGLATRVGADADEAFAVVHHACAALTYSLPHEIGHIIGARHDRLQDVGTSPLTYGHGYVIGTKWRDIMSYKASCQDCPRLPFWSNPTIKIRGETAGTVDADNARVILEQAARVAAFR